MLPCGKIQSCAEAAKYLNLQGPKYILINLINVRMRHCKHHL